ncbi:MAG: DNA recombination protein RmuC [Patescibacteria group bacterium]|jgi:DNA recombination protein RmuC
MAVMELVLIIGSIFILFLGLLFILLQKLGEIKNAAGHDQTLVQWLSTMQQSLEKTNTNLTAALSQNNKNVNDTLTRSTEIINRRLDSAVGIVSEASKEIARMNELGKSIKDLQFILQAPKLRGNLGEEVLADMLGQVFPKGSFFLQHSFKCGVRVDAAIKTTAGVLCIDAKFPVENYQKKIKAETETERLQFEKQFVNDVKKHIKDISQKYILLDEGTVDFAFMYLPSEAVFFEIANQPELLAYARQNRIYPVSPNTLYAHLQTVLLSFEGQRIEKRAKQVMSLLKSLQKEYDKLDENLQVLGKHLMNASNQYNNASQQSTVLGQKLSQTELLESGD